MMTLKMHIWFEDLPNISDRNRSPTPTSSGEFASGRFCESEALVVAEGSVGGSSQDLKCGNSSFLRASLGSVVYSVAEV